MVLYPCQILLLQAVETTLVHVFGFYHFHGRKRQRGYIDGPCTRLELSLEALPTFLGPVSAFQEDMTHRLASVAALALIVVDFVDGVEIDTQANLACAQCVITELIAL
jgi:hypothetical protein